MTKKDGFPEVVDALTKRPTPKLKGAVVSEEEDNLVIKTAVGVFRVGRASIVKEEKTDEGMEFTLEPDSKLIRESLIDLAASVGAVTPEVFGPRGMGGIVAKDCDCRCLCDCRCDCDCRCLCDDDMVAQVLTQVQELARFGKLNINLVGRVGNLSRRV
jgi:hypothetical protein